jgi:hypothetical protein
MKHRVTVAFGSLLSICAFVVGGHKPAAAQTIIEMSALKCGDYLESPPERQVQYAAWMSGYFNAMQNRPMVDLKRFATNKALVEKYCRTHKKDILMNVIRKIAI